MMNQNFGISDSGMNEEVTPTEIGCFVFSAVADGLRIGHSDGKFLGTMECQWFFTCQPLVSMVFPMIFPLETMVFQWFFIVGPLVSMVFPMVFPLETMVFQWFFAVEPLVSMVFLPLNHWYQWFVQWLLTVEKTSDGHQWFTE